MFKENKIANQVQMFHLLYENKDKINKIMAEQKLLSFVLFGDDIAETTSGIAKINIIIIDDEQPSYMALVRLQQDLTQLLNESVNIYTQDSLKDQFPEFHIQKLDKAKSLEQICNKTVDFTPPTPM